MNETELNEILLSVLRLLRLQVDFFDDVGATTHAVRQLLVESNQAVATRIEKLESEAKAATSLPRQLSLQRLDDIIRKLESQRPLRVS